MTKQHLPPARKHPSGSGFMTNRQLTSLLEKAEARVRDLEARVKGSTKRSGTATERPIKITGQTCKPNPSPASSIRKRYQAMPPGAERKAFRDANLDQLSK